MKPEPGQNSGGDMPGVRHTPDNRSLAEIMDEFDRFTPGLRDMLNYAPYMISTANYAAGIEKYGADKIERGVRRRLAEVWAMLDSEPLRR